MELFLQFLIGFSLWGEICSDLLFPVPKPEVRLELRSDQG